MSEEAIWKENPVNRWMRFFISIIQAMYLVIWVLNDIQSRVDIRFIGIGVAVLIFSSLALRLFPNVLVKNGNVKT